MKQKVRQSIRTCGNFSRMPVSFGNVSGVFTALCTTVIYIGVSASLIELNKYLMGGAGNFKFPLALCIIHQFVTSLGTWLCFLVRPDLFPGIKVAVQTSEGKFDMGVWLRFIPIGAAFAGSVLLSNMAYEYCSVPFIQMLKEGNVVLTFIASIPLGLERFSRVGCSIILIIFTGGLIAATGEIRFSLLGLIVQISSQICEVSKILGQNLLMRGKKLDPLSVVLFTAPLALVFLGILMLGCIHLGHKEGDLRLIWTQGTAVWHMIAGSAVLAFFLNITIACMIWSLNATGFVLAGIAKDITIVFSSILLLHEHVTRQQLVGFSLAIVGIMHYSMMKMNSDCFEEDRVLVGFKQVYSRVFLDRDATEAERKKLLKQSGP